jgi:SAM-dependent methyltransferase
MSEERAERGAGSAVRASERATPLRPVDEEIAIDVGEVETVPVSPKTDPSPSPAPVSTDGKRAASYTAPKPLPGDVLKPPTDPPPPGYTPPPPGRRPRNRLTLRIPDDEVVRPSSAPAVPVAPVSVPVSEPSIDEDGPLSWDSSPPTTPEPSMLDEEDGHSHAVPPDPPTVQLPPSPDTGRLPPSRPGQPGDTHEPPGEVSQEDRKSGRGRDRTSDRFRSSDLPVDALSPSGDTPKPASYLGEIPPGDAPLSIGHLGDSDYPPARPPVDTLQGVAALTPLQADAIVVIGPLDAPSPASVAELAAAAGLSGDEDEEEAPVSVKLSSEDDLDRHASPPPDLPPRSPMQSSVDIPVETDDFVEPVTPKPPGVERESESAPPLDIDLERLSSNPAPAGPAALVAVPPSLPPPKAEPTGGLWLAAARPPALAILAAEEGPAPVSSARLSEPGDTHEVSPEDVVSVESVRQTALGRSGQPGRPPPAAAPAGSLPPLPPQVGARPPLVVLPTPAIPAPSPLAPPPMSEGAMAAARRRIRPWWEDLFNDDFIRTMAKITDSQIAAEASFIEDSLGVAKGAMVLDLACGTGRHAIELTRRGYQVVGFDLSLAMLARAADEAQDRNQKLNFVQGDMRDMTFEDTFDGVYCWSTSFGYFEEEKNAHIISNVRRALKTGGQFLLDVINRDFLARQAPSVAWFEGDGCVCMDEMVLDWITSRMRVKRTMMMDDGRTKETEYSIRVYSLHELGKLLHDSGFRVADVSGRISTPGVFLGADSPSTLILAEKR